MLQAMQGRAGRRHATTPSRMTEPKCRLRSLPETPS